MNYYGRQAGSGRMLWSSMLLQMAMVVNTVDEALVGELGLAIMCGSVGCAAVVMVIGDMSFRK